MGPHAPRLAAQPKQTWCRCTAIQRSLRLQKTPSPTYCDEFRASSELWGLQQQRQQLKSDTWGGISPPTTCPSYDSRVYTHVRTYKKFQTLRHSVMHWVLNPSSQIQYKKCIAPVGKRNFCIIKNKKKWCAGFPKRKAIVFTCRRVSSALFSLL